MFSVSCNVQMIHIQIDNKSRIVKLLVFLCDFAVKIYSITNHCDIE